MQRRSFLKNAGLLGSSVALGGRLKAWPGLVMPGPGLAASGLLASALPASGLTKPLQGKRIGVIGLDTSHSVEFARVLNTAGGDASVAAGDAHATAGDARTTAGNAAYKGYRVTAAYPYGSRTIASSYERIPGYIEKVKSYQVAICSSVEELLNQVDCVLLETNDGHLHAQQALEVFQSHKPVFIDKPLGANLKEVAEIYKASAQYGCPFFTSSVLRYTSAMMEIREGTKTGKVLGATCYAPATIEPGHEDLYWYGIHGVEMLFAAMGPGCKTVQATHTTDTDIATGVWEDGRIGTFRGTRSGIYAFGGTVFGEKANALMGDYEGYEGLLKAIIDYFETGKVPVPMEETKEIYAFMSAYQKSKKQKGKSVRLEHF